MKPAFVLFFALLPAAAIAQDAAVQQSLSLISSELRSMSHRLGDLEVRLRQTEQSVRRPGADSALRDDLRRLEARLDLIEKRLSELAARETRPAPPRKDKTGTRP